MYSVDRLFLPNEYLVFYSIPNIDFGLDPDRSTLRTHCLIEILEIRMNNGVS